MSMIFIVNDAFFQLETAFNESHFEGGKGVAELMDVKESIANLVMNVSNKAERNVSVTLDYLNSDFFSSVAGFMHGLESFLYL
jgi:hypothetical protein